MVVYQVNKHVLLIATSIIIVLSFSTGIIVGVAAAAIATVGEELEAIETTTLREFLTNHHRYDNEDTDTDADSNSDDDGVYMSFGPAFFGFYGYFGALAGIEDALFGKTTNQNKYSLLVKNKILRGVTGASAGAMTAVCMAAGISPHVAAEFVSALTLHDFQDFYFFGSLMKGDKFESIMNDFISTSSPIFMNNSRDSRQKPRQLKHLQLDQALIPVAVSTTNILPQTQQQQASLWSWMNPLKYVTSMLNLKILRRGSMARAARASACFPGLFQPVGWIENNFSLLIDGGIFDPFGLFGLKEIINEAANVSGEKKSYGKQSNSKIRVLNMIIGEYGFPFKSKPYGPLEIYANLDIQVDSVLSVSIINLPRAGPFLMKNGITAQLAARDAIKAAMDRPIESIMTRPLHDNGCGNDVTHHYVLEIDASSFY